MIKLIVSICMIANANVCKDIETQFDGDPRMLTPYKCMLHGQEEIAKMMQGYAQWRVTRFKCVEGKKGIES